MKNNFYIEFESKPRVYRNPRNQKPIERKLESLDNTIKVSNCAVTITLQKDGSFTVEPNPRNIDKAKLLKRVT